MILLSFPCSTRLDLLAHPPPPFFPFSARFHRSNEPQAGTQGQEPAGKTHGGPSIQALSACGTNQLQCSPLAMAALTGRIAVLKRLPWMRTNLQMMMSSSSCWCAILTRAFMLW